MSKKTDELFLKMENMRIVIQSHTEVIRTLWKNAYGKPMVPFPPIEGDEDGIVKRGW